ncbi:ATP-binding cassette domain-containing protein [Metamycoplasma spumans]|uniref:ATP-binding cassette domain-containing protein n=1 Tax=Metamycoplasma spumans TaxID=92406 RepID=UPI0034DDC198
MNKDNKKVILTIDNLKKYFVNQGFINKAVDGVSFDLHEGEIVGLIGESGSGKTTVGRTILRLYDDFNGFVKLEDKIISGKNISNRLRKFLRKNVQMIFQDPHASLNGQQNIYSILKEPLLVNGVMKSKINDIFKDWLEVKKAFKYTFHIEAMKLELQNYREINRLAKPLFANWIKRFENLEFDSSNAKEDNFALFYGYLEEKQHVESLIINNMYSNASRLIEFYYDVQKRYRNDDLTKPEINFKNSKLKLARLEQLSKQSIDSYEAKKELKIQKENLRNLLRSYTDLKNETKNTFNNYIHESKNEKMLISISRLMSTDLNYYLYTLKNEILMSKRKKLIKEVKSKATLLGFEVVKKIINEIDNYIKNFYNEHLGSIVYTKHNRKNIDQVIENNFSFDYQKYVEQSSKNENEWRLKIEKNENKIKGLQEIIARHDEPAVSASDLEAARQELSEAKETYEKEKAIFLANYKKQISDLYQKTKEEKALYHKLVDQQTICNAKFEEYKNSFFVYLEEQAKSTKEELLAKIQKLEAEPTVKSVSKIKELKEKIKKVDDTLQLNLKMYKSDLNLKEDTLKSFAIERKYLEKDVKNIYLLLGIDHAWVEKNLSSNTAGENPITESWEQRKRFFDSIISFPIAKFLISELLYKMIIYKALEDVGLLKQFAYRYPHEFSGGQLQRIVIARALITEPKVIVADEPIASLDISIQAQVVNLLKELCIKKNIGLIFIAHDLSMIEYVADNVQIMHLGKIVESGKTEAIYSNPVHPYTINLFKAIPKISNANEKFQNVSFALDYLDEQQFPNVPETFKINENHYVYGTKEQVKKWVKENEEK